MQALATPRQPPQHERAPPLSLRSRSGRVTPLPDLDVVELGRQVEERLALLRPRLPLGMALLIFRFVEAGLRILRGEADRIIAAHEAEDAVEGR